MKERDLSDRPIEEIVAGNAFRDTVVKRADSDSHGAPLWHGWVIMDAFLAGIDWARRKVTTGGWVRNGTIVGQHTEIDLHHEATDTWITIKADDKQAELVASRLLSLLNYNSV